MASRSTPRSTLAVTPDSTVGIGGKSSASVPFIFASKRAHLRARPLGWAVDSTSIRSLGSELTNSVSRRAGTVMAPSSSTCAPIQVLIAISRLVADSFNRDWSVDIRTFWVIGSVVLVATALPTTERPRLRFSWRQDSRMRGPPRG